MLLREPFFGVIKVINGAQGCLAFLSAVLVFKSEALLLFLRVTTHDSFALDR